MASNLKIEIAREEDLPELAAIINPSFQNVPSEVLMFGNTSAENLTKVVAQHLEAWRIHATESSLPCAIKCVHTNPDTEKQSIAGCAEWFIFDRERTAEEYEVAPYLLNASWMTNEVDRMKALSFNQPIIDKHKHWMGGRPHAILRYMAVAPDWRRKGIATMCVHWGLDRCRELGIPAYLEASEEGAPVYERLGFTTVDLVTAEWAGESFNYPVMIWWPKSMREKDRVPALQ